MKRNNIFKIFTLVISLLLVCAATFGKKVMNMKVSAANISYEQFEQPDYVSIKDITGKNKLDLLENNRYTYPRTAAYGSVVFQFDFEMNQWSGDDVNMQIYLMLDEPSYSGDAWWNSGNYFWFQSNNTFMMQQRDNGERFNHQTPSISSSTGTHRVEVGRIAVKEENGACIGRYYCFIKVDGNIWDECINQYDPSALMNSFHITGRDTNPNRLVDINWTGNKVTYVANKQVVDSFLTKEYKLEKPADPVVEGKEFVGWFDDLGNQWDFDVNEVSNDLTLTAAFVSEESQTIDNETYFADDSYTPVLRFLVSSDTHIGQEMTDRNNRLAKEFAIAYQYAENSNTYNNLDAALFAGDLSDDGSPAALANWKKTVDESIKDGTAVIVSMGNHEFRTYDSVTREVRTFEEALEQKCDYHVVVNGFHFIALSPNLNEGYNFSEAKVAWLEQQLEIASDDTPDKPIFVMQHEGVRGTVYGSQDWGMDELTETLCKYPQVVDFSGHSHYPLSDPRSIWQGTFTALGTGTLHYYEMGINGYKNSGVFPVDKTGGFAASNASVGTAAEFQIVELDANNAMRVIVYDLLNDREITRYYMRNLLEDRKLTYSHTERAKLSEKPYFEENAQISATVSENAVTVEFDQAKCKDIVESYRIEFYKKTKLMQTEYALSDYFFYPMPDKIKVSIRNLSENTNYTIKVYAVNVWGQECEVPLETSATTGQIIIYEDVIDEISLHDLHAQSGGAILTTDTLNSYKPVYFTPSENNVYGSFKLTMQLLYVDADFQICFDEEFNNDDLIWVKNTGENIWFIKENFHSSKPLSPGLHVIEYQRRHVVEGNTAYTIFSMKVDSEGDPDYFYHEYKSKGSFTNNGKFNLNFNSCYAAGSRYYDISETVPTNPTPEFTTSKNIELSTPITNWSELGGAISFDSTSKSLNVWLEDASGAITDVKEVKGSFILGDKGDFYHYEIKTNSFDLVSGVTGNESVTKFCFSESDWQLGNLKIDIYEQEVLDVYDEISIFDISILDNNGLITNSPAESGLSYNGSSPSYSAVFKYYLVTGDLNSSTSEFRTQLGTIWSYFCTLWLQPGDSSLGYFGFQYSTRPTDRYALNFKSREIYLIETGTIRVLKGEWANWNYTYFKVNNELYTGFYVKPNECSSTSYQVAFKVVDGYTAADVSLARNIEYIVDGKLYKKELAISGTNIYEPAIPTKDGAYFTGWYTQPEGGERVDYSKVFTSDENTVKYYARYSTDLCKVNFYSEGDLFNSQDIGRGGQALEPEIPTKSGTYSYSFVKWVIKGTDTEFSFTDPIADDIDLEAVFEEYKYRIVYKADGLDYETRYYLESNPSEIIGNEPAVPEYKGATGYWDYQVDTRVKGDTYAIARYNGKDLTQSNDISLGAFNGKEIDIADELTRFYLSFVDTNEQANWLTQYPVSGGHERQDITFTWSDMGNNTSYEVYFADNDKFENAFVVKTSKTLLDDVGIFIPGQTYYWKVVGVNTQTQSAVDTFKVLNTPTRWISAGTVFNVRDLGGWTTTDGKQLKYGKFYRGGQLSLDQAGESSYMNQYSFKVFDYLGIKTEIELRGECTHRDNQFNEFEDMYYVNGTGYLDIFKLSSSHFETYRRAFAAMADESNYPFYFHCSWGADRTGTLAFFIEGLLGVPYEQLVQDYELTSLSHSGLRTRVNNRFEAMYEKMLEDYGDGTGNLQVAITNYLVNYLGVKQSEIDAIREIMLEDAVDQAVTHKVTYMIDGQVYLQSKIPDGGFASSVAPIYFDKHLDYWTKDGQIFNNDTPITEDITLEAHFTDTHYEDYDVITLRDIGLGDSWTPYETEPHMYTGYSINGSRMFEFDYQITSPTGEFNDGVHVELGFGNWIFKSHLWIAGSTGQHAFTGGDMSPTISPAYNFEYGKTYRIQVGVVCPIDGPNAGKKMFIWMVNGEIIFMIDSYADLSTKYIGLSGTQGVLYNTPNLMTVTFKDADGSQISLVEFTRGQTITAPENPQAPENQKFVGWYDELGNQWNFETDLLYKATTLFARYGDVTTQALVLDNNDFEIISNYQVKVGASIGELDIPTVKGNLEFAGWYQGENKLSDNEMVVDGMDLICRFNVVNKEPDNPVDPINPDKPKDPSNKGCKGDVSSMFGFISILALASSMILKKKEK